nr:armadillo repeat-containing protein 12 isoform X3 [Cavia porcellus]
MAPGAARILVLEGFSPSNGPSSHLGTGSTEDMGRSIPECLRELDIRKSVVGLATGAGALYLLYKAVRAGIQCKPPLCTTSPICIARLAIERERHGRDSGELRRLLNSLECKQDAYNRSMILHSITRCVYLLEAEASACSTDDIRLLGDMLDDDNKSVKIQALNALKAFSGIRKFRLKIQEHTIKVLELISTIWDTELHVAGLRLLNNLPLPDFVHPQLRRVMPSLMEIVQSDHILSQVHSLGPAVAEGSVFPAEVRAQLPSPPWPFPSLRSRPYA